MRQNDKITLAALLSLLPRAYSHFHHNTIQQKSIRYHDDARMEGAVVDMFHLVYT